MPDGTNLGGAKPEDYRQCIFCKKESAKIVVGTTKYWVMCGNNDCRAEGPFSANKAEAIAAWDEHL